MRSCYASLVRKSSIAKHLGWGPGSDFATTLGARVRKLRLERRMTQGQVGGPLSRAFISAVEHGRVVPSLAALNLMAQRMNVPVDELLPGVNRQ